MQKLTLKMMVVCLSLGCTEAGAEASTVANTEKLCEPNRQAEVYASGSSRACAPGDYSEVRHPEKSGYPQQKMLESQAKQYGGGRNPDRR